MGQSKQQQTNSTDTTVSTSMDPTQAAQWKSLIGHLENNQFQPYTGQRVADPNQNQLDAWNAATGIGGLGQDQLQAASQAAQAATGYSPQQVEAQRVNAAQSAGGPSVAAGRVGPVMNVQGQMVDGSQIAQGAQAGYGLLRPNVRDVQAGQFGNLDPYMNQYNNQVVDAALGDVERSRQMAVNQGGDAAAAAGAFGGSRHGVADSLTNEAYARQSARTAADLRARGFDTAAAIQQQDLNRSLQAGGMNQGADAGLLSQTLNQSGQTAFNNQNTALNAGLANQRSQLAAGQTNAQLSTQASMANAANQFQNSQFNANLSQGANLANQRAMLQAGMANQGAGLQANQQALAGAGLLGNLGAQAQNMGINGMNALGWAGGQQYGIDQARNDAGYQDYLNQQGWNQQNTQQWMQALGMQPNLINQNVNSTNTQTVQRDRFGQILGAGLGLAGTLLGGPAGGAVGGAIGGMFGGGGGGGSEQNMGGAFNSGPYTGFTDGLNSQVSNFDPSLFNPFGMSNGQGG